MTIEQQILIIDDNLQDQELYQRLLSQAAPRKYVCTSVSSGKEGLDLIQTWSFDCILLDYKLPDLDGLEFLSDLASRNLSIQPPPIIILTGQGNETVAVESMKKGASDYLVKGQLTYDLLARTISHAIEKHRNEKELKKHYQFLNTLVETIPNPIFYKNREGMYTGCNHAFEKYIGMPKEDIIGKTVYEIAPQDLADLYFEKDNQLFVNPGNQTYEASVKYSDGSVRDVIFNKATYEGPNKEVEGLVGIMVDISERKQMEEALKKANDELEMRVKERTAALEEAKTSLQQLLKREHELVKKAEVASLAKSQFLNTISHELLTPMNAIIGMNMLLLNTELSAKQHEYAKLGQQHATDLLLLIKNVLDFSDLDSGPFNLDIENFRLDEILLEIAYYVSDKNAELTFTIGPKIPNSLIGDSKRLLKIFHILIENGIKFSNEKAMLCIGVNVDDLDSTNVKFVFSVQDQGVGISPENIDKVLNASLVQGDGSLTRKYEGLGLGLSIAKRLIELMDGQIWVESEIDIGSTFFFSAVFKRQENEVPFDYSSFQTTPFLQPESDQKKHIFDQFLEAILRADPVKIGMLLGQLPQLNLPEKTLQAILNHIKQYDYEKAGELIRQIRS